MLSFSEYFLESYDTVQDFLTNPIHNDKHSDEWMAGFEADGGKMLGSGKFGAVYSHPKWPYVVKVFTTDDPYIKFMRWAAKNPHSAFPKMYGPPRAVIPPYTRQTLKADKFYAVRLEKLNPVTEYAYQMFDRNKNALARYFYLMDNPEDLERSNPDNKGEYVRGMKDRLEGLPPEVVTACYGYYLLNRGNYEGGWGQEDLHRGNIMQRDDGAIVLADPVWYGYDPYADADYQMKMETDYYGGGEHDPEPTMVRGGKLPKPIKKKKVKPEPVKPQPEPSDDDIPF